MTAQGEDNVCVHKPWMTFNNLVSDAAASAQELAQAKAQAGLPVTLELHYLRSQGSTSGNLLFIPTGDRPPANAVRAPGDCVLTGAVPYAAYWAWIHRRAVSLPILATET